MLRLTNTSSVTSYSHNFKLFYLISNLSFKLSTNSNDVNITAQRIEEFSLLVRMAKFDFNVAHCAEHRKAAVDAFFLSSLLNYHKIEVKTDSSQRMPGYYVRISV